MKHLYVTITGFRHYYGLRPLSVGNVILCRKEPDNSYDGEAIRCSLPAIGTVGYLANSPDTVAGGTMSAGRVYDRVEKRFYVRVLFTTFTKVICRMEDGEPEDLEREMRGQTKETEDDLEEAEALPTGVPEDDGD